MTTSNQKYKLVQSYWSKAERIPVDWQYQKLKSFINILSGYPFESQLFDNNEGIPLIRIRDLPNNKTKTFYTGQFDKTYIVSRGDLLVGMDGEFKPYLWKGSDALLNQRVCKIRTNDDNILDQFFLYYVIRKGLTFYEMINSGTTVGHISKFDIENIKVYLPPLLEQQKIASVLSKVDYLLQKTDQIIEQTERLKKGLMQILLTKGIGHTEFKNTEFGEIPQDWNFENLGKLLTLCQYGLSLSLSEKGMYPIFRMNNIENGYMITNDMKYIDLDKKIFDQFKLEKDDILINRTNSIELVGKLGIFILEGNYTFASYLIRMRTKKERLLPFFLNLYLNTKKMQYKLKSLATPGVSQANINAPNLKSLNIPVPPLNEQERIISVLLEFDSKLNHYQFELESLSKLKRGLMQQLLTGKIRVKV